jgi:hypothetical protein
MSCILTWPPGNVLHALKRYDRVALCMHLQVGHVCDRDKADFMGRWAELGQLGAERRPREEGREREG